MLSILTAAIALAANPWALIGYLALGLYATSVWRAIRYGALWGLAIQLFTISLGNVALFDATLPVQTALRLVGAAIITVAVYYLSRLLRRR